ncbi:MAG: FHA domain-containing protein [Phycisphaerales bacterium]
MPFKLVLTHLRRSEFTGTTFETDSEVITIGRRPNNAVVFTESTQVSGNHAEVRLEGSEVILRDLQSRNGTYMNGLRIAEPTVVRPGDRITLGETGPEFTVEAPPAPPPPPPPTLVPQDVTADIPVTVQHSNRQFFSPAQPPPAPVSPPAPIPVSPVAQSPIPLKGFDGRPVPAQAPPPAPPTQIPAPRAAPPNPTPAPSPPASPHPDEAAFAAGNQRLAQPSQPADQRRSIGQNTFVGLMNEAIKKERSRSSTIVAVLGSALALVVLVVFFSRGGTDPQWKNVMAKVEPSLFATLAMQRDDGSTGTAWAISDEWLATNAHVALPHAESIKQGQTSIAVGVGPDPIRIRIVEVRIHPGYEEFAELLERAINAGKLDSVLVNPCDVAIMRIDPEDARRYSSRIKRLSIAPESTIRQLGGGDEIAFLGYPQEGVVGGGLDWKAPKPNSETGTVRRATNAFLGSSDNPDDRILLGYTINVSGGGSGSPVFNKHGEVVGLISAMNTLGTNNQGTRLGMGGMSYGPRADLVLELLHDEADTRQRERSKHWRQQLESK